MHAIELFLYINKTLQDLNEQQFTTGGLIFYIQPTIKHQTSH